MVRKFFLFLSDHVVTAYEWQGGFFSEGTHLELNKKGLKQFEEYLDQTRLDGPVYLLIDVTEEELHEEIVPKLMGSNRKKIIRPRSGRIFRNTPYIYHRFQGTVKGDKKKEHTLFMGLTDPENVTPWLEILTRRQAEIAGIWSLPLLALHVFNRILPKDRSVLLISPNSGGLRQIFVQNGKIKVSRLSHLPSRNPEHLTLFLHGEIARLQGYLATLRLLTHDDRLNVYVLCPEELLLFLTENSKPLSSHEIHPVDAQQLAIDYNLKSGLHEENVDVLFGQYLVKHRIGNHYAQPEIIHRHMVSEKCHWLRITGIFLFFCGLGFGLWTGFDGYRTATQLPSLMKEVDEAQITVRKLAIAEFDKAGGGRDLVSSAQLLQKMTEIKTSPQQALVMVSRALASFAELWIDGIVWESSPRETTTNQKQPAPKQPNSKQNNPVTGRGGDLGRSKLPMANYGVNSQTVRVTGQLYPFNGSPQEAQAKVEQFINALRSMPNIISIETEKMPMDAHQNAILDSTNLAKTQQSSFILKIMINFGKKGHG